jgi:CheY-like chemotaxis protein
MKTILLVDDDPFIEKVVRKRLQKAPYEIRRAENGRVGVEQAFALEPDLILMDTHMPELNGPEAVIALRARGYTGTIVALTACDDDGTRRRCQDAGCDGIIPKPFGKEVVATIARLMDQKEPSAE